MAAAIFRMRRRVGGLTAAALLLTSVQVASVGSPAKAAPAAQACVSEQADEAAARRMVEVCRHRVEVLSERSETTQIFLNVDGTSTLEESVEPVRVRKGAGWVPVDTTLRKTADGVAPAATVLPMTFSAGGDRLVGRVRDGERDLSITWSTALPEPQLRGSTAIYRGVLPSVDLHVTAQATGFSEVLVVHDRQAAAHPALASLKFGVAVKGVKITAAAGGGLVATDAQGKPVFRSPAPLMWDSSQPAEAEATELPAPKAGVKNRPDAAKGKAGAPDSGERSGHEVMPLKVSGNTMTLTPNRKVLTDPQTKFPVYIDPQVTGGLVNSEWTSVWSKHPTSSFWKNSTALTDGKTFGAAGAGRTEDCDGCADHIVRSFFRMNVSAVRNTKISAAEFRIEQRHSWTCNPASNAKVWMVGGISSATTWKNQPRWYGLTAQTAGNRKYGAVHGCKGPGTAEFNVKPMVEYGVANNWSSLHLALRAIDEGTLKHWKRFNPSTAKLAITFNRPPNAATERKSDGKPCAVGTARPYVLWTNPTLSVKHSDPDGGTLTTDFYWWVKGGSRSESNKLTQSNGNNAIVSRQIPTGRLTDGGTYAWQAKTSDGSLSTWSGTCEFTVDATPPPDPAAVTSTNYPSNTPSGGVGIVGEFAISPPTVRPHEVVAYAWTLDSGVMIASQTVPAVAAAGYAGVLKTKPLHDGINTLRVWSKDHAGRFSVNAKTYTFHVRAGTGPAAEWTFDEAAGTTTATDISAHGNTLTLGGGAARATGRGGEGQALSLNGTTGFAATPGPVSYPHPDTNAATAVRTDSTFTVTARVRLTSASGVTGQRTAVAVSGSRTSALTLGYSGADNRWRFAMAGSDADNATTVQVLSNAAPVAGKWTHLSATYNVATKKLTLYVNGVAQTASGTLTGGFNATGALTVGKRKWNGADDGFLNGAVDDVRLYSFLETAAKLAELALPLQPAITLPNGEEASAGGTLKVTFSAGGDTNVTKFKYSLGGTALEKTVNATAAGGTYSFDLPVGSISGQLPLHAVAVDDGSRVSPLTQTQITVKPAASLFGTVLDQSSFQPVAGAVVRLQPGGAQVTTDADGTYAFASVTAGAYTVRATSAGRCGMAGSQPYTIDKQGLMLELYMRRVSDNVGHTCTERTAVFPSASTVLPLTGDDAIRTVDLPFAFPFYGGTYRSAWVDTNGVLSFVDPLASRPRAPGAPLVSAAEPNALVAPYWDDLVIDSAASIRTGVTGSGAAQQAVVEWRNVHRKGNTAQRLSFAVTLGADGTVATHYDGLDNADEQGAHAVVGIESMDGQDGLAYSTDESALANGTSIVFTDPDNGGGFETYDLSGTLTDAAGAPVAGATVQLDPSGLTATTATNGSYSFLGLVGDGYTLSTRRTDRCGTRAESQVEVFADTVHDLRLAPDHGVMGYACTVGSAGYVPASTPFALSGDDVEADVTLPFTMPFYGRSSNIATVSTNGWVGLGGGYLEPFWGDLVIDGSAGIRTQAGGSAPNRSFTVEWRNALVLGTSDRVTFELVLHEGGRVAYHYGALSTDVQRGSNATVGMEALSHRVVDYFSSWQPTLTSNSSITWTPGSAGIVRGVLTESVTTTPIAGATVTLNPGNRSVTSGPNGEFEFDAVPVGAYQLLASQGDDRCLGQYATSAVYKTQGEASVDLSLNADADQYYHCTVDNKPLVAAPTVQNWTGDDESWKVTTPFPVKLYGESTTTPYVSSNGFVSFSPEGTTDATTTPIPSGSVDDTPNSAVYGFWGDWVVDGQAAIATGVSGTAPNREWTVEWRNVSLHGNDFVRATFQVRFAEDGAITLAYDDIDPTNPIERGASATVGLENPSGTAGFQYLYAADLLEDGLTIRYAPAVPAENSISGTVTCIDVPVEGATVTAAGRSATTAADGTYQLNDIPAKTWPVVATVPSGECAGSTARPVLVGNTAPVVNFALDATVAGSRYLIAEESAAYQALSGSTLLTGRGVWAPAELPFPVTVSGQPATSLRIGSEGSLEFPGAYLYAFRGAWEADSQSSVLTATRGAAPNRQFVVEWRDVRHHADPATRFTFQAVLDEAGGFHLLYPTNNGDFVRSGGSALIGIQSRTDETDQLLYADRLAVLRPGFGLRFAPATS